MVCDRLELPVLATSLLDELPGAVPTLEGRLLRRLVPRISLADRRQGLRNEQFVYEVSLTSYRVHLDRVIIDDSSTAPS